MRKRKTIRINAISSQKVANDTRKRIVKRVKPPSPITKYRSKGKIMPVNVANLTPHIPAPTEKPILDTADYAGLPDKNAKIAIILNVFYEDTPHNYISKLKELNEKINVDVYINAVMGSPASLFIRSIQKKGNHNFIKRFYYLPNCAKDIYAKLNILADIYQSNKEYDYVFLMHDKKSKTKQNNVKLASSWISGWARDLTSLVFDDDLRATAIKIFNSDNNIGAIGSKNHLHFGPGWHRGMPGRRYSKESKLLQFYSNLTRDLGCQTQQRPVWFVGGTMFWVRWESIKFFFDSCKVKNAIDRLRLETGDVKDPSYTHAFERFFGAIPVLHGKKLVGI